MGYYTSYSLKIFENKSKLSDEEVFEKTVTLLKEMEIIGYALDENLECREEVKWYDNTEDMIKLSKEINDVVFELSGEGEESRDLWKHYFLNGAHQLCRATLQYEKYDETKLSLD